MAKFPAGKAELSTVRIASQSPGIQLKNKFPLMLGFIAVG